MIFGFLSGEWLLISTGGVVVSAALAFSAPENASHTNKYWMIAVSAILLHHLLMRTLGKTPIGIALPTEPAGRGHPRMSLAVSGLVTTIWIIPVVL